MKQNVKNGAAIVVGQYVALKEGTGKCAGKKGTAKLLVPEWNAEEKKEVLSELWVDFWNGDAEKNQPQLYTKISETPRETWIAAIIAAPNSKGNIAVLDFLSENGHIQAFKDDAEVNVFVGKPHSSSNLKEVTKDGATKQVYNVNLNIGGHWYQIGYFDTKNAPSRATNIQKVAEKNDLTVFIAGKLTEYTGAKSKGFTCSGASATPLPKKKVEDRLPETPATTETPSNEAESTDIVITIGIHEADKPLLSALTESEDIGWMRAVLKYYKPKNSDEQKQYAAIEKFVKSLA